MRAELRRQWLLPVAVALASTSLNLHAASDADRIRMLEEQLQRQKAAMEQQQKMLEAMESELQRLKTGQPLEERVISADESAVAAAQKEAHQAPSVEEPPEPVTLPNLEVYGFVMADAIYDFKRVDPDWNDTLRVTTIPTQDGFYGRDGEFVFSVRQSRLGVKSDIETDVGTFSALLEAELFGVGGDAGQTTPRLRHAWVTWNDLGMGQYWSNFMDADVFPNTIDYWGPTGMVFYRNQQIRYSWQIGEDEFAISLEDPDTSLTVGRFRDDCIDINCGSTVDDVFQKYNDIPDLTMRWRNNTEWGHYQVAGIARKLGFERLDTGQKDSEFGWGINTSTVINTWGQDKLKLQLVYGEGIGNYLNDGGLDIAPRKATATNNEAVAVPLLGIVAYYDHYWNEKWSSSFGWSTVRLDTTRGQGEDEFEDGSIAQVNLLHYPRKGVLMGGELAWGERNDISGADGYDVRVQFSLKVNFPLED
ncbi:MAG: DcaP family trimeric outer membrane transporter [Pseudomonadota bacterium]